MLINRDPMIELINKNYNLLLFKKDNVLVGMLMSLNNNAIDEKDMDLNRFIL